MGTVGVEIAVKDDQRLLLALDSLAKQTQRPDHVLVAASPKTPEPLVNAATSRWPSIHVEVVRFAGGPVDARTSSLPYLREEVTAFLDSDEIAPPTWLATIVAPIEAGRAAYAGGPTRPLRAAENPIERYYELLEASIYADLVPASVTYLPLGNSAWRTSLVREFGFDPRVTAEDHDLETRVPAGGPHRALPRGGVGLSRQEQRDELRTVGAEALPLPVPDGDVDAQERGTARTSRRAPEAGPPPPPLRRGGDEAVRPGARVGPLVEGRRPSTDSTSRLLLALDARPPGGQSPPPLSRADRSGVGLEEFPLGKTLKDPPVRRGHAVRGRQAPLRGHPFGGPCPTRLRPVGRGRRAHRARGHYPPGGRPRSQGPRDDGCGLGPSPSPHRGRVLPEPASRMPSSG